MDQALFAVLMEAYLPRGSAAGCISCITSWRRCPRANAEMFAAAAERQPMVNIT